MSPIPESLAPAPVLQRMAMRHVQGFNVARAISSKQAVAALLLLLCCGFAQSKTRREFNHPLRHLDGQDQDDTSSRDGGRGRGYHRAAQVSMFMVW